MIFLMEVLYKIKLLNIIKKSRLYFSTSNDMAKETSKYTDKKIYITPFE